jgi:hypothetical protein
MPARCGIPTAATWLWGATGRTAPARTCCRAPTEAARLAAHQAASAEAVRDTSRSDGESTSDTKTCARGSTAAQRPAAAGGQRLSAYVLSFRLKSASAHQQCACNSFPKAPETVSAATAGRPQPHQCYYQPAPGRHRAQSARGKKASSTKESRSSTGAPGACVAPCQTALHLWGYHEGGDPSPGAGPGFWCDVHGAAATALLRGDQPSDDGRLRRRQQQQTEAKELQQSSRTWQWAAAARTPGWRARALSPHCGWP